MRFRSSLVISMLALGVVVLAQHDASTATVSTLASKEVSDGVYTNRQADRGKDVFSSSCAMCHGASLSGGGAPPLAGSAFLTKYKDKTLSDLFGVIKTRMPASKPGSLTSQQVSDTIAYILQVNKFKNGNSLLPPDATALKDIAFDKKAQAEAAAAANPTKPSTPTNTTVVQGPASGPRTAKDGVFTAEQVAAGQQAYSNPSNACFGCHGPSLGGSPGGPSLSNSAFRSKWTGKTVADMFTFIQTNMPPGRAGSMEDKIYLEIVAFILQYNGYPVGVNELKPDMNDLKQITIPK